MDRATRGTNRCGYPLRGQGAGIVHSRTLGGTVTCAASGHKKPEVLGVLACGTISERPAVGYSKRSPSGGVQELKSSAMWVPPFS